MSMTFNSNLDLNNTLASRLLVAIGFAKSTNEIVTTCGEMPVEKALAGLHGAQERVLDEDREYLFLLEEEIRNVEAAGGKILFWW
jgi:hypothetical protein